MATLHDRSIATFQLISREFVGAVECGRLAIGDIVLITKFTDSRIAHYPSPLNLALNLAHSVNQLATHIRQLAVGDEEVEVIRHINLGTLIDGIAKFGELANKIFARRLLGQLMFGGEMHLSIASTQFITIIDGTQRDTYGYPACGAGLREDSLELLIVVAIERHTWAQSCRHLERIYPVAHHAVGAETFELAIGI